MSVIRHWLAYGNPAWPASSCVTVLDDEQAAAKYGKVGYRIEGPFVPADQLTGAVGALDTLRDPLLAWRKLDSAKTRAKLIAAIDATLGGH